MSARTIFVIFMSKNSLHRTNTADLVVVHINMHYQSVSECEFVLKVYIKMNQSFVNG